MSAFDERYDIRLATRDDVDAIRAFIEEHWRKGHILAANEGFFEYEHVFGDEVRFALAVDREDGRIMALAGFLRASSDGERMDVWRVLWKARPDAPPLLGTEIMRQLDALTGARSQTAVGDNPRTAVLVIRAMFPDRLVDRMRHHYLLAPREEYRIAKVVHVPDVSPGPATTEVRELLDMGELRACIDLGALPDVVPHKDEWYVQHRFFEHPVYRYRVFALGADGAAGAVCVVRLQEASGACCLRIVDYIGDQGLFGGTNAFWRGMLEDEGAEYVDFYNYGFDDEALAGAGFAERTEGDENVIPNYFAPFVQENVEIWLDSTCKDVVAFKADSDQDRPS